MKKESGPSKPPHQHKLRLQNFGPTFRETNFLRLATPSPFTVLSSLKDSGFQPSQLPLQRTSPGSLEMTFSQQMSTTTYRNCRSFLSVQWKNIIPSQYNVCKYQK